MKANKAQLDKALATPASTRFFLFHGPDEPGSRALARTLAASLGPDADAVQLSGADLREDPARLGDEAASISMFGGRRYVIVEPAGDESLAAVEALADAPIAGNPVALIAGALRPTSKLLKFALAHDRAIAFASYPLEVRDSTRLAIDTGRAFGLMVPPDLARRVADAAGGNRALIGRELEKYALFLDASPDRPQSLDEDVLAALGIDSSDGNVDRLVDSVSEGNPERMRAELDRLDSEGVRGIALLRPMLRRAIQLARTQSEPQRGGGMPSFARSSYQRQQQAVQAQALKWPAEKIAKMIDRLAESERLVKCSGSPGDIIVDEALFAIARQAARLR